MPPKSKTAFREQDYDLVLDAVCANNRNTYFTPARYTLRGELRASELKVENNGALSAVGGVVPGQRMLVDTKAKHIKIIDRMTLPEHKALDEQMRKLHETDAFWAHRYTDYLGDVDFAPSEEEWPKWLYCMARCVEAGTMRLVRGNLPSSRECRALGEMTFANDYSLSGKDGKKPFNVLPQLESVAGG